MDTIRQVYSILFVLGLLGGALWWLRSRGSARIGWARRRGAPTRSLNLIERLQLTPQHSIHLVRMGDCAVLIGTSPSGCSLIEKSVWKDLAPAIQQSAGELQ
jgi:flagellar biogenesis protein FliO